MSRSGPAWQARRLIALAGLRPGEVLAVRAEDFDASTGHLAVRGWGGRSRRVLIDDPELQLRLAHWARASGRSTGLLFCAPGLSIPLRDQSLRERWERYTTRAGVELALSVTDSRLSTSAGTRTGVEPARSRPGLLPRRRLTWENAGEPETRIELVTYALRVRRSAD